MKTRLLPHPIPTALLLAVLLLVSCQKDNPGMQLIAEGFNGTKASVEGLYSYWVDGETVLINGVPKTVTTDGTSAYISSVSSADVYRALYPDTLNSTAELTTDNVHVLIPRTYTYMESNGRQRLGVPMAAYGTSESRLLFQHLTAALTVEIKNTYGFTIEVDSVVVVSNNYQLCGEKDITLAASINVAANSTDVAAADKKVKVCFNGGTSLQILAGQTRRVQVPVLPVGNDNRFTIRVGVHKVDDDTVKNVFERTQGGSQGSYALGRRQMGYAGVIFGGVFSASSVLQVIISQGNLQYVPSTEIWSFHSHQYDVCETNTESTTRYRADGNLPIDLFGYGTSGNLLVPYMTNKNASAYNVPTSDLAKTENDWGWHNAISNGGNAVRQWYSLTSKQWRYIFNTRSTTTTGINSDTNTRFTYATINNGTHKGVILFPDVYSHPTGIPLTGAIFNRYSEFTAAVSYAEWAKMEAAGAVFLPLTGYRFPDEPTTGSYTIASTSTCGMYWCGGSSTSEQAYRIRIEGGGKPDYTKEYKYYGMAVRLVKDL